jgi:hypothetical protein
MQQRMHAYRERVLCTVGYLFGYCRLERVADPDGQARTQNILQYRRVLYDEYVSLLPCK